ncbi:hypothetical protein HPB48_002137 [Haemaphysalis longicornis]|uniref:HTH CENPB-type domain-containing protein n=1 Tax=Haemaphysalis longicornis TaxID=44386 RepID=A0A9J6FH77_HAELO|nr:hypothetical protein HPB48_002137 [Haemaphysalis longicornis]
MPRKHTALTLGDKIKIIEEAEKRRGATKASLTRELNIPKLPLKAILAKKDDIFQKAGKFGLKRKVAKDTKLEEIPMKWLQQARSTAINVDGTILKEKAGMVALHLVLEKFGASNSWLDSFKRRHGIVYSWTCGESSSVEASTVDNWVQSLPELIEKYRPCDIFNADEMGITTFSLNKCSLSGATAAMLASGTKSE